MQEEGWPLGLRLQNARIGLARNRDLSGSISFSTLLTGSSSCSSISSSDLDTMSTGSFFRNRSITLGSLIGIPSILDLSRRSTQRREADRSLSQKINCKTRPSPWLFSLCPNLCTDAVETSNTQSLGRFLEAERREASCYRRNQSPEGSKITDVSLNAAVSEPETLSLGGGITYPGADRAFQGHNNGFGVPLLFPCNRR